MGLGLYVDRLNTPAKKQELRNSVLDQVSVIRARIEGNISNNAMVIKGLVAAISIEPDMSKERFIALSSPLLSGHSQIRNIAAAPDLVISDTGEGISVEQQEHIFEPFYTTKEEGKGTGLGLAMVYGFVQRSGGFIGIHSEVGVGTAFKLYLPRFEGEEESLAETKVEKHIVPPRGKETLLIVDDEEALLKLASAFLASLGYRVFTSTDGKKALKKLHQEPGIDLLISDVVMPGGINGFELAKQASTEFSNIKVLLTSGYAGKVADASDAKSSGSVANILNKPYSQNELAIRVRAILDNKVDSVL